MIDDDAEYELRRQIRAQADADVASFISSLDQDETTGVPPAPVIKVSEVASDPIELDFIGFGDQESGTAPGAGSGTGSPPPPTPCCPTPSIVCDQISASKEKCGFAEYGTPSDPPKRYLTKTWHNHSTWDANPGFPPVCHSILDSTQTVTVDTDNCTTSCVCSGTYSCLGCGSDIEGTLDTCDSYPGQYPPFDQEGGSTIVNPNNPGAVVPSFTDCNGNGFTLLQIGFAECLGDPRCVVTGPSDTSTTRSYSAHWDDTAGGGDTVDWSLTVEMTDEYTTDDLIENTVEALPPYPETWDGNCTAARDLSDDETAYSIYRFKYKFTWADPLEEDCKIAWSEQTYDADGNLINETQMSETVSAGQTESSVYEVIEPSENGTIIVAFPIGPCCVGADCSTTDEATCTEMGGDYQGDGCVENGCTPNPCT